MERLSLSIEFVLSDQPNRLIATKAEDLLMMKAN